MPLELSQADFQRLSRFIQNNYGINLTKKYQLIVSRLSTPIEAKGYSGFAPFIDQLIAKRIPEDIELVINKLTTNYTYFMREEEHFKFFRDTIMPNIVRRHQRDKVLSIWSAGCSSGEEPYTISMYLLDYLGAQAKDWDTRILATDISQRAMAVAQTGVYELPDTVPPEWRRKYFVPDSASGRYRVAPVIKNNVIFKTFNLMDPIHWAKKFDVIFCRNVMIYFDADTKDALVNRFYNASVSGGYLLIGHSETINREKVPYQFLAPSTFSKP